MTTLHKDCRGNWTAEDNIALPDGRQLRLSTHKVCSGNLVTTATVGRLEGGFFSYTMYQDFSKRLATAAARCTAKVVATQHEAVLANIESLKQEIAAFYSAKVEQTA